MILSKSLAVTLVTGLIVAISFTGCSEKKSEVLKQACIKQIVEKSKADGSSDEEIQIGKEVCECIEQKALIKMADADLDAIIKQMKSGQKGKPQTSKEGEELFMKATYECAGEA